MDLREIPLLDLRALLSQNDVGESQHLGPIVEVSADSGIAAAGPGGPDLEALRHLPLITMMAEPDPSLPRLPIHKAVDLLVPEEMRGQVMARVRENPQAAVILAQLLRATENLPVLDAIELESFAYATLQSGSEFSLWLSNRPLRREAPPTQTPLSVTDTGEAVTLTLNRPESANALNMQMRAELVSSLSALALTDVGITLAGSGPHFCAGGDLREFGLAENPAIAHMTRMRQNLPAAIARVSGRVTARVHGSCVGAGMEMSSFAGRVVAAPGTTWRLPEVSMGLLPGCGGTVSIPRRIGRQRTLLLALADLKIGVDTALSWGLIDEVGG